MAERIFDLPKVSVIIPVFNGESSIGPCIEHLNRQTYPEEIIEIIAINDGSTDKTSDIIRGYGIQYITVPNKGPANARNEGIKLATGQILIFIDADCLADENLIIHHVLAHLFYEVTDPLVKVVGGGIGGENKNFWSVCDDFCSWYNNHPSLPGKQVEAHPTANFSFSRQLAEEIKFDEELRFAEDYAFCVAVIRKGYKIYFEPQAKVRHINRSSYPSFMKHAKDWASSQYKLLEKGITKPLYTNPWLIPVHFAIQVHNKIWEITDYAFQGNRFDIFLYMPFILVNKLYLNYFTLKYHWAFYKSRRISTPGQCLESEKSIKKMTIH
jgi:glycosyltransferase involved in cell wall biosynthesis